MARRALAELDAWLAIKPHESPSPRSADESAFLADDPV
jgi:hypothetical protein